MGDVQVHPVTPARWNDVMTVFGARANACWCQRFRRHDAVDNRAALHDEITHATTAVGLIAYSDDEPLGWTRVVPRSTLPGIVENRALATLLEPDESAWWVSCFAVRRARRGGGVGVDLLRAAVDWATDHGGRVLDGHPVDVAKLKSTPSPSAVFTGTVGMFERAGFVELGRTYPSRPVMRKELG